MIKKNSSFFYYLLKINLSIFKIMIAIYSMYLYIFTIATLYVINI